MPPHSPLPPSPGSHTHTVQGDDAAAPGRGRGRGRAQARVRPTEAARAGDPSFRSLERPGSLPQLLTFNVPRRADPGRRPKPNGQAGVPSHPMRGPEERQALPPGVPPPRLCHVQTGSQHHRADPPSSGLRFPGFLLGPVSVPPRTGQRPAASAQPAKRPPRFGAVSRRFRVGKTLSAAPAAPGLGVRPSHRPWPTALGWRPPPLVSWQTCPR